MNTSRSIPNIPVPSVRLIVPDTEGKVLLLRRAKTAFADQKWCLPGGKVDYGETVEHAAQKELTEETALTSNNIRFLFYQDSLAIEPGGMHCINFYFRCEIDGDLQLNLGESSEHAWISQDDIDRYEIVFRNDLALKRYWEENPNR